VSSRFFRPRSIVRLVLLGFAAVAIPLIAAVITAVVQVDRLAQSNRQAVLDAETATHESRALIEHLTGMERSFGQYQVLGDRDFYLNYVSSRAGFDSAARRLISLDLGEPLKEELRKVIATEAALNRSLVRPDGQPLEAVSLPRTADQWAQLHNQARAILAGSSELIARHANKARDESARLQRTLLLQGAAAVPVAVLLGLVFAVLIARPLRQVDAQVRRLGAGRFAEEVRAQDAAHHDSRGLRAAARRRGCASQSRATRDRADHARERAAPAAPDRGPAAVRQDADAAARAAACGARGAR
jgi:two-component system sensor histidine kinase GlrK